MQPRQVARPDRDRLAVDDDLGGDDANLALRVSGFQQLGEPPVQREACDRSRRYAVVRCARWGEFERLRVEGARLGDEEMAALALAVDDPV
jgi:hypothetical protein